MIEHSKKLKKPIIDPVTDWRERIFKKINITISRGQKVLDIGCGDGGDALIFVKLGGNVMGIDIKPHPNWQTLKQDNLNFKIADACALPFEDNSFDLVFEKDMLHHVNNPQKALSEIWRVTKKKGEVIIVEGNRYNPISYSHMVLIQGHQHLRKRYFKSLMKTKFRNIKFQTIDTRVYPVRHYVIMKIIHFIEDFLEKVPIVSNFLSYNIAVAKKDEH